MSERGVFGVDRGVFEHDKLRDDKAPFSKVEAWLWLIAAAAWRDHRRRVSGRNFDLKRGQLVASTRYMAERWRWTEARVRRFLDLLKTDAGGDAMIDARSDAGVTVITIRKYNQYQRVSLPGDAPSDAGATPPSDAAATQQRRNKEDREYIEGSVGEGAPPQEQPARGKSLISEDAFRIASEVVIAMGRDPSDPISVGAPLTVQGWLNIGLHRDHILTGVRRAMQNRKHDPPSTLKYFEKAILRAKADLAPVLPAMEAGNVQAIGDQQQLRLLRPIPGKGGGFGRIAAQLRARGDAPG